MYLSIVIPIYNEEPNIIPMYNKLVYVLKDFKKYEIIFVDDGSSDRSYEIISRLNKEDKKVKAIRFRKNFGQTAAMDAGIKAAKGNYIITMDADLQNDPEDIPRLLRKIEEGYDVVSGWRYKRRDPLLKKIFSLFANALRKKLLKERIHDSGCTLKIYKKICFENLDLYGEMHRYIPGILSMNGFKVGELKVRHHSRKYGKTKYGYKRLLKGFLDLFLIAFLMRYSTRPLHFFGSFGVISFILGFLIAGYLTLSKILFGMSLSNRPLLILGVLLIILGVQFFMAGVLADILMKNYYRTHKKTSYNIKEKLE